MARLIQWDKPFGRVVAPGGAIAPQRQGVMVRSADYQYKTGTLVGQPPAGELWQVTGSLNLQINVIDADGYDHRANMSTLKAGDLLVVGTQSALIVNVVPPAGVAYAIISVDVFPALVDGVYPVTVIRS